MIWTGLPGIKCKNKNERTQIVNSTAMNRNVRAAIKLVTEDGLSERRSSALHVLSQAPAGATGRTANSFLSAHFASVPRFLLEHATSS